MWAQTNQRFLDRGGCGDELYLDADQRASAVLASLYGGAIADDFDDLDDSDDDVAAH